MDGSAIICDEIIKSYDEEIKTIPINFNENNITCKPQSFYFLLAYFLITIVNSCQCILLSDKMSSKTKQFITQN